MIVIESWKLVTMYNTKSWGALLHRYQLSYGNDARERKTHVCGRVSVVNK